MRGLHLDRKGAAAARSAVHHPLDRCGIAYVEELHVVRAEAGDRVAEAHGMRELQAVGGGRKASLIVRFEPVKVDLVRASLAGDGNRVGALKQVDPAKPRFREPDPAPGDAL